MDIEGERQWAIDLKKVVAFFFLQKQFVVECLFLFSIFKERNKNLNEAAKTFVLSVNVSFNGLTG